MEEKSINQCDLSTMCRLCLSRGESVLDIFRFSTKMGNQVLADVIMKCAPVQIMKCDGMPKFICKLCYNKLEKNHRFQMQILQSDKTLRCYEHQLRMSDIQIKTGSTFIQEPSEDPLFYNTNPDITVKCESLERHDVFYMGGSTNDNSLTERADDNFSKNDCYENSCEDTKIGIRNILNEDMTVNWKEKEQEKPNSTDKIKDKVILKSEHQDEQIDDRQTECSSQWSFENITVKCEAFQSHDGFGGPMNDNTYLSERADDTLSKSASWKEKEPVKFNSASKINVELKPKQQADASLKPYQCDVCYKCFNNSNNLKSHERTHTGVKPYQCDVCNKCFTQSGNLDKHKLIHNGVKQFQCNVCNKAFTVLCSLIAHKRTHTGEKPYQCDVCNKSFTHLGSLIGHKRIHSGIKPYQCDVCNKCFSQLSNLKSHKRTHTGVKPYQCDICNRCFTQSSNLDKHKRVHTDEKLNQCF